MCFIEGRISRIDSVVSILRVPNLVRRHDYMGDGSIFFFGVGSHLQIGESLTDRKGKNVTVIGGDSLFAAIKNTVFVYFVVVVF